MNKLLPLFGALRISLRSQRPSLHSLAPLRALSTSSPTLSLLRHARPTLSKPSVLLIARPISLASIFGPRKITPTPPPAVVANIATLEAEANANPSDVRKQLDLFSALIATGVNPAYDVVIARWERICDLDPSNEVLQSDPAFEMYLTSLHKRGLQAAITPAVQQREKLVAAQTSSVSTSSSDPASLQQATQQSQTSEPGSIPLADSPVSSSQAASPSTPLTPSQKIAQAVLAKTHDPSPSVSLAGLSSDMSKLATALSSGSGVPGNPIVVTIAETKGSWIPSLARFMILTAVTGFFILVGLAVLLENSGLMKAGPRQAEFEPTEGKTYKFSDVHGVDEAKEELQEVVEFLKDPTSFATLGGKLPKGVLLTGPPGTGKTMLARAVAGEAGVPFLFASGSEFDEMFVGVGAKRVRDLFAAARKNQPAIIFIDELDAIGGKRSSRDQHYMKQTLNQLLVEMDGFLQSEGVIVIAATNFPDSLDPALVRPGRFDRHVSVPLPDVRGRVQILQHHMKGVTTEPSVDPMILARGTPGFSGADLQNMVNQAAVQASREGASAVGLKHFEWAKDKIIMGAQRRSTFISEEVKKMTAYHEGGHALVSLYTEGAMPLHKVTCVPRGHALGVTSQLPKDDRYSVSLTEYLAEIDVCMGGRVAEELIYGPDKVTSGASSDLRRATQVARAMVKNWGYSDKIGPVYFSDRDESISPQKRDEIELEVRRLLVAGQDRVTKLLKERETELHRLANALVEHETLDAEEVRKVIKGETIRNIDEVIKEDLTRLSEQEKEAEPTTS